MYKYSLVIASCDKERVRDAEKIQDLMPGVALGSIQNVEFTSPTPPSPQYHSMLVRSLKEAYEWCGDRVHLVHMLGQNEILPYFDFDIRVISHDNRNIFMDDLLSSVLGLKIETDHDHYIKQMSFR